jgi:outer membrane protein OmpA-like peptidoglycan-associated protein
VLFRSHAIISAEKSRNFQFKFNTLEKISLSNGYSFEDAYDFFKTALFIGNYNIAKQILSSAIVTSSSDARKVILDQYKDGLVWDELLKDTTIYTTSLVSFNSNKGDFNPIFHPNGLVFTSARELSIRKNLFDNSSYLNLYLASKNDTSVAELKFLETNKHDGTAYYDSVNFLWFFSKNLPYAKENKLTRTGLFIYNENTKLVSEFPYNSKDYFIAQPCLTEDKNTLWFSSDMPGGYGGADIWYSVKNGETWSAPINAGQLINTSENEMFPFIQNNILHFSSNGHVGLGGLDIFSVDFNGGLASNLKNMGANLNSNADDFSLILDSTQIAGYFSSNRSDFVDKIYNVTFNRLDFVYVGELVATLGEDVTKVPVLLKKDGVVLDTLFADNNGKFEFKGDKNSEYVFEINSSVFTPVSDNYSTVGKTKSDTTFNTFDLSPKYIDVLTNVFDDISKKPLVNTKVDFVNKETGEVTSFTTDKNGQIKNKLLRNSDYEIVSKHKDYKDYVGAVSTVSKAKAMELPVPMKVMELTAYLKLNMSNVRYTYNKWDITPQFEGELDKIVDYLNKYKNVKIQLRSYTDSRGDDDYNMMLSEKRANSCVEYLISKGIDKNRLDSKWFGETQLLNNCSNGVKCSEKDHQANRRTEFVVVE